MSESEESRVRQQKKLRGPISIYQEYRAKKQLEREKLLLRREEQMKEDLENFLMEIEERKSWNAYELKVANFSRMKKQAVVNKIAKDQSRKDDAEKRDLLLETGLSYFKGDIKAYRRWQNSSAKHLDIKGHKGVVYSCRLSKCLRFIFSCSEDKTAKLWELSNGECVRVYSGHTKKLNDCDIHPNFKINSKEACLVTCSGDTTLKLWNSYDGNCTVTMKGHTQAVYRCSFAPDGNTIVSCSEDRTIRTWCFPEGFQLYIYRGHTSPVTTVNFSPTGRYLISGSDYGERKLLLWDAKMPVMNDPQQFPHMLFWTPEGLIKKILLQQQPPVVTFWLDKDRQKKITDDNMMDIWVGADVPDVEIDSESEEENSDDDEVEVRKDVWGDSDTRQLEGVTLSVVITNLTGEQVEAEEYIPGSKLVVSLTSAEKPLSEAFIDVMVKNTQYDSYHIKSGYRLGQFVLDDPIPWDKNNLIVDKKGTKNARTKPYRIVPTGLVTTADDRAVIYSERLRLEKESLESIDTTQLEVVWHCEEAGLGPAVICVNFKFRLSNQWQQLTYSMKESPIRVSSTTKKDGASFVSTAQTFDPMDRHRRFWDYVREKNWEAVASFIDKKAVVYRDDEYQRRRWRIMNILAEMFEPTDWIILHTPFLYEPGVTKSVVLCDTEYEPDDFSDYDENYEGGGEEEEDAYGERLEDPISGTVEEVNSLEDQTDVEDNVIVKNNQNEATSDLASRSLAEDSGSVLLDVKKDKNEAIDDNISELSDIFREKAKPIGTIQMSASKLDAENSLGEKEEENSFKSEAEQEPTDYVMSDPRSRGKMRLKSRPLELPPVHFCDVIKGKEFEMMVENRVKIEADNLSSMVYLNAACSSEARYYSADPVVFQAILQYLNKAAPSWMRKARHRYRSKLPNSKLIDEEEDPTVLALQLQKTVHGENNSSISFGESSMLDDAHCAFVEQYNMIQSGIFGPDIVDFTMPLPPNYPRMAGLARFALQDSITNYQKILNSMKKKSLPTTANEVYVPTIVHKLKQAYHKAVKTKENEHRAKLEKSLAHDVRIHLLSERVYYTARRQSYYQLPCMTPHYPNPNYETPAVVPVFNTVARVKEFASDKNFYAKLFGRKITISVTAEPVGRKTVPDDMDVELISIPTTPKAMKPVELSARPAYQKNVKSKKGKSAKGGKTKYIREGSLRSFGRNSSSKFSRSISSKSFRQSIRSSKVSTSKGSTKTSSTSRKVRTKSVKLKRGGFSKSVKGSRKSRSKKLIQVPKGIRRGSIRRKSAQAKRLKKMQDDNNFRGSIKSMRRSSKKDRKKYLEGDETTTVKVKEQEFKGCIPAEVFLGRRGSHPVSPGLEDFTATLRSTMGALPTIAVNEENNTSIDNKEGLKVTILNGDDWNDGGAQLDNMDAEGFKLESAQSNHGWVSALNPVASPPYTGARSALAGITLPSRINTAETMPILDNITNDGLIRKFSINGFELAHHGSVNDAIFSTSESRVVSGGGDALIKIWDPRDGSFVRRLAGHSGEVFSLNYTVSEQFLVSAGADQQILIWSMLTQTVCKKLLGHCDVIYSVSISPDCSVLVSGSHDQTIRTWYTTPRHPDAPEPPRMIAVTDTTVLLTWKAPPSFSLEITAFHLQYRIGRREKWYPVEGLSIPPHFRSKVVKNLMAATHYQFRIRAENKMGLSGWSGPSKLIRTDYGLPEKFEDPIICGITPTSMFMYWFAANPDTFGSASQAFEVQCKGNGRSFDENRTLKIDISTGIGVGRFILQKMQVMYDQYLSTKDKIIIKQRKVKREEELALSQSLDTNEIGIHHDLNIAEIGKILEASNDKTKVFIVAEYQNLRPGFLYVFQTRGVNIAGAGPWSEQSVSNYTLPTRPHRPKPPRIEKSTLRTITFIWDPPDTGGAAITGYRVMLKHNNRVFDSPRSTNTFLCEGLFPGNSYFIKVYAKNIVGNSEYSDWNSVENSYTKTAAPEQPMNPIAVDGTWESITLQIRVPFNNGSNINKMYVEQRLIEPFAKGDWRPAGNRYYHIPDEVSIVEAVDTVEQQREVEAMVRKLEDLKMSSGFNPYGKDRDKLDKEIEDLIEKQKPPGSLICLTIRNLESNNMYEFRVKFYNATGESVFSQPSHRARTNKATLPDICSSPAIIEIGQKHILLEIAVPSAGGAPIKCFHLEVCNLQDNSTKAIKIPRNESDNSETMQYKLQNLSPNGYFMFRCRAESAVGMGKYSMWTGEIKLRTGTNISVAKSASKSVSTAASKVANQVRFVDSNPMHAKNNSVNIADPLVGTMAIDMIQHNKESDANDGNHSVISDISTYESLDGDQKEYFDDRNFQEQQAAQGQEIHLPPTSTFKDF